MSDEWGVEVGYRTYPSWKVFMDKWLLDWQEGSDCKGDLIQQSKDNATKIVTYPQLGKSVFPQICDVPQGWVTNNLGIQAIPQNVILTDGSRADQFTVGVSPNLIPGANSFIPLVNGNPYLVGKSGVEIALGVLLVSGIDYLFNPTNGQVSLLQGRVLNPNETYTVFSYT